MAAPLLLGLCGKDDADGEQHRCWKALMPLWKMWSYQFNRWEWWNQWCFWLFNSNLLAFIIALAKHVLPWKTIIDISCQDGHKHGHKQDFKIQVSAKDTIIFWAKDLLLGWNTINNNSKNNNYSMSSASNTAVNIMDQQNFPFTPIELISFNSSIKSSLELVKLQVLQTVH